MFKVRFITFIALLVQTFSYGQEIGQLKGKVKSNNISLEGVSISIGGSGKTTQSDKKGNFLLSPLAIGSYTITASSLGYRTVKSTFEITKIHPSQEIVIILEPNTTRIDEVEIIGRSTTEEVNRQPYNVTAIDAKKLHNTTLDIGQALNRVSGARMRESGGVGSNISFSLNGFSGNQVKLFLDGIPMDNFGSSFQLNNIPINFAERVEVYRGVVPIWLGGDALGGAVNIVTQSRPGKYLDASYSYGSFNTHKSTINTGYVADNGFTLMINAFQNFSDNNYWVNVKHYDPQTSKYTKPQRTRRFHDQYRNETLVMQAGVSNKSYADQLLFGITVGENRKEIQTGNNMYDVYGGRETRGSLIQPSLKYIKNNLFTSGLDVRLQARYNMGKDRSIDTIPKIFNWSGQGIPKYPNDPMAKGGEAGLTDYRYKNNNGNLTASISYNIDERNGIMVNHLLTTFDRKGTDKYFPDLMENKFPKKTIKNITGLGYRFAIADQWDLNAFVKNYYQNNTSGKEISTTEYEKLKTSNSKLGYGFAGSYYLNKAVQLKTSYEKAIRLPENMELFGDEVNLSASKSLLRPETSDNINIGAGYFSKLNDNNQISVDANYIFRNAKDFIREITGPETSNGRRERYFANLRNVRNQSVDLNVRYYFKQILAVGANMTYQNMINTTRSEPGDVNQAIIYKDRLPNTPYLYGNADVTYYLHNFLKKANTLSIGYNLQYIHEFFLDWPSLGDVSTNFVIPQQLSHDVSLIYTLASGRYNVAFECNNLTDVTRFDNFEMQKPSRSFHLKLRYFINGK